MKKQIEYTEYKKIQALNASTLKRFAESELEGYWYFNEGQEDTTTLSNGRIFHEYIDKTIKGEEKKFHEKYIILDNIEKKVWGENINRRKKEYQEWKKELLADGKIFIPETLLYSAQRFTESDIFKYLIKNDAESEVMIMNETTLFSNERKLENNVKLKGMLDLLRTDKKLIVDWKTMADIPSLRNILYTIKKYKYNWQAAFYSKLTQLEYGDWYNFLFVFIQITPPYEIGLFYFNNHIFSLII